MPLAQPVVLLKPVGEGSGFEYRNPDKIVTCRNKEELHKLLEWYSYPFIKMRMPDDPKVRRRYVEQVRPALRWFCKKFQVDIPDWLQGNAHYDSMEPEEAEDFFGKDPLQVFEFSDANPSESVT